MSQTGSLQRGRGRARRTRGLLRRQTGRVLLEAQPCIWEAARVRERAVRKVKELRGAHPSLWAALESNAPN
jgi:hypothetical protein